MNLHQCENIDSGLELWFKHGSYNSIKRVPMYDVEDCIAGPEFILRRYAKEAARDILFMRDGAIAEGECKELVDDCIAEMKRNHPDLFGVPA